MFCVDVSPTDVKKEITNTNHHGQVNYSKKLTKASFFIHVHRLLPPNAGFKIPVLDLRNKAFTELWDGGKIGL